MSMSFDWLVFEKNRFYSDPEFVTITTHTATATRGINFQQEVQEIVGEWVKLLYDPNQKVIGLLAAQPGDRNAYKVSTRGPHSYGVNGHTFLREHKIAGGSYKWERSSHPEGNLVYFYVDELTPEQVRQMLAAQGRA